MKRPPNASSRPTLPLVRCALYTCKSTEEGLQQEFNSLDAQRESAEAYVASQQGEGWVCLADRYGDGTPTNEVNNIRLALRRLKALYGCMPASAAVCYPESERCTSGSARRCTS